MITQAIWFPLNQLRMNCDLRDLDKWGRPLSHAKLIYFLFFLGLILTHRCGPGRHMIAYQTLFGPLCPFHFRFIGDACPPRARGTVYGHHHAAHDFFIILLKTAVYSDPVYECKHFAPKLVIAVLTL